ncbi:MAG: molybdate ABC transporter substrate-binding protein [Eubacteriaceae bacterium]
MKFNKIYSYVLIMFLVVTLFGCTTKEKNDVNLESKVNITVSAAASLCGAMDVIKELYEAENSQISVTLNYGSSGSLQRQIEQGADVDIYFSAAKNKMETLKEENLIYDSTEINLLTNSLVVIVPKDMLNITSIDEMKSSEVQSIGMGEPDSVPAGKYAEESLMNLNIIEAIKDKIIYAKNVKEVLAWVETGNVEVGMVYRSDALSSDKVDLVIEIPEESHNSIVYPAAIIKSSSKIVQAKAFLKYLQGDEAKQVFEEYGFNTIS